jgi:hypothetical protein
LIVKPPSDAEKPRLGKDLLTAGLSPHGRQSVMQTGKIGRQFRPQLNDFTGEGVFQREYMGMEGLPAKGFKGGLACMGQ